MGGETSSCHWSPEEYASYSVRLYKNTFQHPCLFPDVGIDMSLLKYSGMDSNAVLQSYSNGLVDQVPGYTEKLGAGLGSFTSFSNAVGLGALVISMIIEIIMKTSTTQTTDPYSMFTRVFGEEKASGVRDTMSEYVKRHKMYINNKRLLQMEICRLEKQLSNHLTILRNSLLLDGQMRSRGFKIWVNGASFHVQMLIHEARLNIQTGINTSDNVPIIQSAITTYSQDLDHLLEKYKAHKTSTTEVLFCRNTLSATTFLPTICAENYGKDCEKSYPSIEPRFPYDNTCVIKPYINHVFSNYKPLLDLKSHFLNLTNNLNYHINQHGSFTLPSAR